MSGGLRPRHTVSAQREERPLSFVGVTTGKDPRFVRPLETRDPNETQFTRHRGHIAIDCQAPEELSLVLFGVDTWCGTLRRDARVASPLIGEINADAQ